MKESEKKKDYDAQVQSNIDRWWNKKQKRSLSNLLKETWLKCDVITYKLGIEL